MQPGVSQEIFREMILERNKGLQSDTGKRKERSGKKKKLHFGQPHHLIASRERDHGRSLPSQDHLLRGSSGDSPGTKKSLPLLWDAYTGMRSRQLYGSLRLHISHELNNQTYSLAGLHFLLGYQIHSTEAMETKK